MQPQYPYKDIEQKARHYWDQQQSFYVTEDRGKPKYYCLSMFPYPSGRLHMGHVRNYTIGDVLSRWHRMCGFNVLQPMGWDAFGLPAENAAIQNKMSPAQWTFDNIDYMKKQLQSLGFAIDWKRELATCTPEYYKWNQWLFLRMLEKGIAYKKTQVVNWDPLDQTVLANEQVIDGRGWRTGAIVEKREIPGYYLGITQYAEELLADLDKLPGWPERVRTMQANWIGKSTGVRFAFPYELDGKQEKLWVFTTRADTIMGVSYCAVAAEHPLATRAAQNNPALQTFIDHCKQGSMMEADIATVEKVGMDTGFKVTHPLSGEQLPVWIANYVLMGYGEGAVMAVPAHDERDFAFAKKYQLPIKQSIAVKAKTFSSDTWQEWYTDKDRAYCVNSGKYNDMNHQTAVDAIAADLKAKGLGEKQVQWRLRDWSISRQRYWGCPIPIIHCGNCGDVAVPDEQLPVTLPTNCVPDGSGNPLSKNPEFFNCSCPHCGADARRETDTMDTFVDSSWYYARYASNFSNRKMVDDASNYWMPVDQYIGGIEHAILHLLYSRFWSKVMRDMGLVSYDEPFSHLLTQGMVLNHIYSRRTDKGGIEYFAPDDVELLHDESGKITAAKALKDGELVDMQGMGTMSKSKLNGVDPQSLIEHYGADTTRFFIIFAAPPEQTLEWSHTGVDGAHRFLRRLWMFGVMLSEQSGTPIQTPLEKSLADIRREIHTTLKQANYDYSRHQFNTVASAGMKILNTLEKAQKDRHDGWIDVAHEGFSILLRLLSPITPHITHTLWRELGYGEDILDIEWPEPIAEALVQNELELMVQVNGKLRGSLTVSINADQKTIEQSAVAAPDIQKHLTGKVVKKIIVVPNKLVNIVVG